ncbi:ABC transporter ATP-binding protein [Pseudonocardia lacus]|uniref:ABC transporter ATP-binding protein n=1 Tax=Pseudonocardia lacus TaxID=2835865 RepID=UPI001BDC4A7E|nr:ATP-binding cassette domain-containing protein [Pseudonocardia lacus]
MAVLLEARGLRAGYGGRPVVTDLDLRVGEGEVVALLGANGAGKTTTLLTVCGELPTIGGEVLIDGAPARGPLFRRARNGLGLVTEERSIFRALTARDNIALGGCGVDDVLALFPELESRLDVRAGLLSGGEQQMLVLGRALARRPRLLLADELSLGLAPLVVERLLAAVRHAAETRGTGVLLVEQHVRKALRYVDRVYVMRRGTVEMAVDAEEARERLTEIEGLYLSTGS